MIRVEEIHGKDAGIVFLPERVLHHRRSRYQDILVIETRDYGRVLLLDGLVMTTERDGFFYHEALVHPVMQHHPDPRKVLILGGGDGGTAREVLRYDVDRVVLVEIDPEVVEVSRTFFPEYAEVFFHPRLEVVHRDAAEFVRITDEKFDVVLLDTSDPVGPATVFYTREFFEHLQQVMEPVSVVGIQAESPIFHRDRLRDLHTIVREVFGTVRPYLAPVPSYPGGLWAFLLATSQPSLPAFRRAVPDGLQFYHENLHRAMFQLPVFLKNLLGLQDEA